MPLPPRALFLFAVTIFLTATPATADEFVFEPTDPLPGATQTDFGDAPGLYDDSPLSQQSQNSDALEARISSMENEIQWLRQNQSTQSRNLLRNVEHQMSCCEVGSGGIFFAAEASFLRPYLSGANSSATSTGGKWIDPTYGTATRLKLGYENDQGFGLRAQYFVMNTGIGLASRFGEQTVGLKLDVIDAEATFRSHLRHWDLGVSGGVRYGYLGYTGDGAVIGQGQLTFEGVGVTAAIDGRRQIGNSNFSLFGNVRGSMLIGEIHNFQVTSALANGSVEDEIMHVIENQMGIAWTAESDSGLLLEVRAAWETQFWINDTLADDDFGIGTNLALSGPSVAIELKY